MEDHGIGGDATQDMVQFLSSYFKVAWAHTSRWIYDSESFTEGWELSPRNANTALFSFDWKKSS